MRDSKFKCSKGILMHDKSMTDKKNIARIQYVIGNFDSAKKSSDIFSDIKNSDNTRVEYSKRINGTICVVEVIPDTKNKIAHIKTMYIKKAELGKQVLQDNQKSGLMSAECNKPSANVRNELMLTTTHSIPQIKTKVKPLNKKDRGDIER